MTATVTANQVEARLIEILEMLGTDPSEITRDAELTALDVDSLDLVEMAQIVEDEFGVKIEGEDVKDLRMVGEIFDLIIARAT